MQAVSGLIADARQLAEIARKEAANYRSQYGVQIPLKYLNDRVSMYMHAYTLYSAVRPYGSSVIIGSYNEADGPSMHMIDPSGVSYVSLNCSIDVMYEYYIFWIQGYHGCATGKAKQAAKTEIEKLKLANMTTKELVKEAARMYVCIDCVFDVGIIFIYY